MPKMNSDTIELQGLDKILKALKGRPPVGRIGILGSSSRKDAKTTNAEVGAAHEYGTEKLPMRSFLRVPLTERLNKTLQSSNAFSEAEMKQVLKTGSVIPWLKKVMGVAEAIVLGAFDSDGYGAWAPWKGSYTSRTGQILVDTQQLRNSISTEVKA